MDGYRWAPYLAVFYSDRKFTAIPLPLQVVLAHPPDRFPVSHAGPSGNVFQLPDMTIRDGVFQSAERETEFALSLF